ncbi:MAG: riboflavin synthase [Candidatus Izemoplasma sp.]|nr:riboflavin synthase [Candidatus Izemoplasma sp.]
MFTGIIEEIGTIKYIKKRPKSVSLTVSANKVIDGTQLGDSIATNGVCLTVTDLKQESFDVDVMYETLEKTAIKHIAVGSKVNLERALTPSTRMGGHIVSGHVDGIGKIKQKQQVGIATKYTISVAESLSRYIVSKGSVAIDGISLTVIDVTPTSFTVSLIPHTKNETTLHDKTIGDTVNIENDIVGKYIEKFMNTASTSKGITQEVLRKYGY